MTGEYNPKELAEEIERAFKNFLEDLNPKAAENLLEVNMQPGKINYTYMLDDRVERSDVFKFSPYDYFKE